VTILASYTFPVGSALSNATVRGYATGRYLNNSGGNLSPNIVTMFNATVLNNLSVPIASSTGAVVWEMHSHFYFTQAVVQAGSQLSIGCTSRVYISNPGTLLNLRTGSYVATIGFQAYAKPFINFVDTTQTVILNTQFNNPGGDTLEIDCAYLEAL